MEMSGIRMSSEFDLASDEVCHPCQPCQYLGKQTNSRGFCKECEEYVCGLCIQYHQGLKATRGHTILAVEEDFKRPEKVQSKNWSVKCKDHEDEKVKFFCPDHSKLGCNVCMVLEHKTCDVAYIPNVAKNFRESDIFRNFSTQLSKFETDVNSLRHTVKQNGENVEAFALKEIETLKRFRDEINALLDEKETALLDRIHNLKVQDEQMLESSIECLQSVWSEYQALQKMFDDKQKDSSKLFLSYHLMHQNLPKLENKLHSISSESEQLHKYQFKKDAKLLLDLKSPTAFGSIALYEDGTDGQGTEDIVVEKLQHVSDLSLVTDSIAKDEIKHDGTICDGCYRDIVLPRYNCITCPDYDLCQNCFDCYTHIGHDMKQINYPSVGYGRLLEGNFVHRGISCDGCGVIPIIGNRHKCKTCLYYDLCDNCMSKCIHPDHELEKITEFENIKQLSRRNAKKMFKVFSSGK